MSEVEITMLVLTIPFILVLIYMGIIAIIAIFFYADSDTDKVQLEYLIEKKRGKEKRN